MKANKSIIKKVKNKKMERRKVKNVIIKDKISR